MGRKRKRKTNINNLSPTKLKSHLLSYFIKNPKKRLSAGQIAKKLKYYNNKDAVRHALDTLAKENALRRLNEGRFALNGEYEKKPKGASDRKTYRGTVDSIKSGAAYILMADLDKDVYVPYRNLNGAVHGDDVELTVNFNRGRNPEGRIVKILKRNTTQIMGVYSQLKKFATVRSTKAKLDLEVFVRKEHANNAEDGDRVLVEITEWGQSGEKVAWGKVVRRYNDVDDHNWTMESILIENGFSSDYPKDVLKEVQKIPVDISPEDIDGRRDFREILTFTIDPDTAQDFDDAISYQEMENGNTEIGVHIADVTHYLKPNTALDQEAYNRSTSVYLVDRCIAMLPEKLSNNLCSLMPQVDRLTFSAVFTFNKKQKLVGEWFGKGIIFSDKRFTYMEAQASLEDKKGLYHKELSRVNKVAYALRKEKFDNGAIAFESDELSFKLDEKNKPIGVFVKERKDAHLLVEDFMLLANRRVAHYIATKNKTREIPFVYRIHDTPDVERLADLALFMKEFGLKLDLSTPDKIAASFNALSEKAKKEPAYKLLMQFAIRTMAKAIYSSNNIGHYGLRFDHYTHFTSPIRRYSDVLVHRILEQNLKEDHFVDKHKLEAKCMHISKQERKAMEAERDSIKYKQVEYMSSHVGKVFEGIVSGMIERGLFVELTETKAEGFIPFNNFYENYQMKPGRFKALGIRTGKSIKLGDPITVLVLGVDLENRQIELEPVNL